MYKIDERHTSRAAYIYIRQSTHFQVHHNQESTRRQYGLADKARQLGWRQIEVVDEDMGCSGSGSVKRAGFERMVGAVGMGQVGAVFSSEASRLARNNHDWYQLVDLCGMVGTLIIDEDGIYDATLLNDRLLLGLKGTMSEFELALITQRMRAGLLQKARRGELFLSMAIGYVRTDDNRCEKDPDERIRRAVELVFTKFAETGSARQTLLWFRSESIVLPAVTYTPQGRQVQWNLPVYNTIHSLLTNPLYAGAYVFGRKRTRKYVENGKVRKRTKTNLAPDEWQVLIKEHHEGYISWEQYEHNRMKLLENITMYGYVPVHGAARKGSCLLAGLLRCSRCGRKLRVAYSGVSGHIRRYLCHGGHYSHGGVKCISFAGLKVDEVLEREILEVVQPAAIEASILAAQRLSASENEKRKAVCLSLEQARYEANRAFRQYDAVDPQNRLVAAELEKRWNAAMGIVDDLEKKLSALDNQIRECSTVDHHSLFSLAEQLPILWRDERSDMRIKKRIVRTLIEEIVADVDTEPGFIVLTIHWKGGNHSIARVKRTLVGQNRYRTNKVALDIVRELAAVMPDRAIASTLNRLGYRSAHGESWTHNLVRSLRKSYSIPVYDAKRQAQQGLVTMQQAATLLGVNQMAVRRFITRGIIKSRQITPYAPHIIEVSQLQTQRVNDAVEKLRRRCKVPLTIDENQMSLNLT